ncbi:hypothetical protein PCANC_04447 [Puccinia coronata f. sp. avenae]|uniref:ATP-dependent DNA helicase n=1 Tax=Puccinia coronata f. sp. avenae TaxID=200324 RepID=A0A2N5VUY5_9BASI|nr:hypothetical protein PCANC_04447 [Puccinia coronata f. sp. avenae]
MPSLPDWLEDLFTGSTYEHHSFQRLTRVYNNAISFTSLGGDFKPILNRKNGPTVVTIKGGLFHKIGTVLPADGQLPAFAQIFVVGQGGAEEAATRLAMATNGGSSTYRGKWKLDPTIVEKLQDFLYSYNPYAKLYRRAGEILAAGKEIRVALVTVKKCGKDYRRYNAPTTEEIGIIIEGDGEIRAPRHVMLETREEEGEVKERSIKISGPTTLNDYFRLVSEGVPGLYKNARDCTYPEIINSFWWDHAKSMWKPRRKALRTVACMHFCSIHEGKRYYIRLLLGHRVGVKSFVDLRTVDGVEFETFREAADDLGLLVNDKQHDLALEEAALFKTGYELRLLFAIILVHSPPAAPPVLLHKHFKNLSDDINFKLQNTYGVRYPTKEQTEALTYQLLQIHVKEMGKSLDQVGLSPPPHVHTTLKKFFRNDQDMEDAQVVTARVESNLDAFNSEQSYIFKEILRALAGDLNSRSKMFYIDGPGGTGKTFLLNTLIDHTSLSAVGLSVVASTGVAALLLRFGQTAHSAFKIPIEMRKDMKCEFNPQTLLGNYLKETKIIIWDEIVTMHMFAIQAVDEALRKLVDVDAPFGGKTVVFAGDFRQTLPVVGWEDYPASWNAKIKSSYLWPNLRVMPLTTNMRLRQPSGNADAAMTEAFGKELLALGEGRIQVNEVEKIRLATVKVTPFSDPQTLVNLTIKSLYSGLGVAFSDRPESYLKYLKSHAILTPLNLDTWSLNREVLSICQETRPFRLRWIGPTMMQEILCLRKASTN